MPSLYERERYCARDALECPIYQAFLSSGAPVSEDAYYQIWLAPARDQVKELHTPAAAVCR